VVPVSMVWPLKVRGSTMAAQSRVGEGFGPAGERIVGRIAMLFFSSRWVRDPPACSARRSRCGYVDSVVSSLSVFADRPQMVGLVGHRAC
jgi:hypothetical protein